MEKRPSKQTEPICFLSCEHYTLREMWLNYVSLLRCMDMNERWELCIFVFVFNFFLCAACRFVCRLLHVLWHTKHILRLCVCVCVEPLCVWLLNAVTGDVISGPGRVYTHLYLQSLPCRLQTSVCKPTAAFCILSLSMTGLTTEVWSSFCAKITQLLQLMPLSVRIFSSLLIWVHLFFFFLVCWFADYFFLFVSSILLCDQKAAKWI